MSNTCGTLVPFTVGGGAEGDRDSLLVPDGVHVPAGGPPAGYRLPVRHDGRPTGGRYYICRHLDGLLHHGPLLLLGPDLRKPGKLPPIITDALFIQLDILKGKSKVL